MTRKRTTKPTESEKSKPVDSAPIEAQKPTEAPVDTPVEVSPVPASPIFGGSPTPDPL